MLTTAVFSQSMHNKLDLVDFNVLLSIVLVPYLVLISSNKTGEKTINTVQLSYPPHGSATRQPIFPLAHMQGHAILKCNSDFRLHRAENFHLKICLGTSMQFKSAEDIRQHATKWSYLSNLEQTTSCFSRHDFLIISIIS